MAIGYRLTINWDLPTPRPPKARFAEMEKKKFWTLVVFMRLCVALLCIG